MRQWVLTDESCWMCYAVVFQRCSGMPVPVKRRELNEKKPSAENAAFRPHYYNLNIWIVIISPLLRDRETRPIA